jgi:hypothetical protein
MPSHQNETLSATAVCNFWFLSIVPRSEVGSRVGVQHEDHEELKSRQRVCVLHSTQCLIAQWEKPMQFPRLKDRATKAKLSSSTPTEMNLSEVTTIFSDPTF